MANITFNEDKAQLAWLSIEAEIDKLIQDLRTQITMARPNVGERWNTFKNWLGKAWKTPFNQWHGIDPHSNEHLTLDEYMLIKEAYQHFEASLNEAVQAPNLDLALSRFKSSLKQVFINHLQAGLPSGEVNPYMAKLSKVNPMQKPEEVPPSEVGNSTPPDPNAAANATGGLTSLEVLQDTADALRGLGYKGKDAIKQLFRKAGAYKKKFNTAEDLLAVIMNTTVKPNKVTPEPVAAVSEPDPISEPAAASEPEPEPTPEKTPEPVADKPASKDPMAFWTPENQKKFPDLYKQARRDLGMAKDDTVEERPSIFRTEKKPDPTPDLPIFKHPTPTIPTSRPYKSSAAAEKDKTAPLSKKTKTRTAKKNDKDKDKEKDVKKEDDFKVDDEYQKLIMNALSPGENGFDALEHMRIQLPSRIISEMTATERIFYHKELLRTQYLESFPTVSQHLLKSMSTDEKVLYFKRLMN